MIKIYWILSLLAVSPLFASHARPFDTPSTMMDFPNSFYPLDRPEAELENHLNNIYGAIKKARGDADSIRMMLKSEKKSSPITALSTYMVKHPQMRELREGVELAATISSYQQWHPSTDLDAEILAINILESILDSSESIRYIAPVLSRYENFVFLFTDQQMSQNQALSFFIFSVLNKILLPFFSQYPLVRESAQLLMHMTSHVNFSMKHGAFLKQETLPGKRAFELLERLSNRLVREPTVDDFIIYQLQQYFFSLDRGGSKASNFKKLTAQWFKVNCTPMKGLEQKIAQIALLKLTESE